MNNAIYRALMFIIKYDSKKMERTWNGKEILQKKNKSLKNF